MSSTPKPEQVIQSLQKKQRRFSETSWVPSNSTCTNPRIIHFEHALLPTTNPLELHALQFKQRLHRSVFFLPCLDEGSCLYPSPSQTGQAIGVFSEEVSIKERDKLIFSDAATFSIISWVMHCPKRPSKCGWSFRKSNESLTFGIESTISGGCVSTERFNKMFSVGGALSVTRTFFVLVVTCWSSTIRRWSKQHFPRQSLHTTQSKHFEYSSRTCGFVPWCKNPFASVRYLNINLILM